MTYIVGGTITIPAEYLVDVVLTASGSVCQTEGGTVGQATGGTVAASAPTATIRANAQGSIRA